jgi:hypothetical protein
MPSPGLTVELHNTRYAAVVGGADVGKPELQVDPLQIISIDQNQRPGVHAETFGERLQRGERARRATSQWRHLDPELSSDQSKVNAAPVPGVKRDARAATIDASVAAHVVRMTNARGS